MDFSDKVVLITGATSGIGHATAKYFAQLGAKLSLTGRNTTNLQKISTECQAISNNEPIQISADLTNEDDVKLIIQTTITKFGKLDVLINNAGIIETGSIESTDLAQFDRIFNTNVRSVYQLTNLAVPYLIHSKGNIVNVSSVTGLRSFPGVLAYCMSKSAIDQFTKCISLELAGKGVRVNCVNPGVIATDLHRRGGMSEGDYQKFLDKAKETHPLGRCGNPDDVAKSIAFLASDLATFSTGVCLPVDGGKNVVCPR